MQIVYDLTGVALSAAPYSLSGTINGAPVNFVTVTEASAPASSAALVTAILAGTLANGATAIAQIGSGNAVVLTVPDTTTAPEIIVGGTVQTTGGVLVPTPAANTTTTSSSSETLMVGALGAAVGYFVGKSS